jgi:hypothetical protein
MRKLESSGMPAWMTPACPPVIHLPCSSRPPPVFLTCSSRVSSLILRVFLLSSSRPPPLFLLCSSCPPSVLAGEHYPIFAPALAHLVACAADAARAARGPAGAAPPPSPPDHGSSGAETTETPRPGWLDRLRVGSGWAGAALCGRACRPRLWLYAAAGLLLGCLPWAVLLLALVALSRRYRWGGWDGGMSLAARMFPHVV